MKRIFLFLALCCVAAVSQVMFAQEPQCEYVLILRDYWGDGWNGAQITVWDKQTPAGKDTTFTLPAKPETGELRCALCKVVRVPYYGTSDKDTIFFSVKGGSYPEELGWSFLTKGGSNEMARHNFNTAITYNDTILVASPNPDPCDATDAGLGIENVKVKDLGKGEYAIEWDANAKAEDGYVVQLSDEKGAIYASHHRTDTKDTVHLAKLCSGKYTVAVAAAAKESNNKYYAAWLPTEEQIDYAAMPFKAKIRMFVPSDCPVDIDSTFYFVRIDPNRHRDTLTMEREAADSRWFKVETTVPDGWYNWQIFTHTSDTSYSIISYTNACYDAEQCVEMQQIAHIDQDGDIYYASHYGHLGDCDAKDHNYNIESASLTVASPGDAVFRFLPVEDAADFYLLTVTFKGGSETSGWIYETPWHWLYDFTNDTVVTKVEITPVDGYYYHPAGQTYEINEEITLPATSFAVKNLKAERVAGTNCYAFSWDAIEGAAKFYLYGEDGDGSVFVDNTLEAEELLKDGKYVFTSDPMVTTGNSYFFVKVYDENDEFRAREELYFDIAPGSLTNLGEVSVEVMVPSDLCGYDLSHGLHMMWYPGTDDTKAKWVQLNQDGTTRWWKATITVDTLSFSLQVGNDVEANWSSAVKTDVMTYVTDKPARFVLYKSSSSSYDIRPAEAEETTDIDRRPKDFTVGAINMETGFGNFTITTGGAPAAYYWVGLYKSGETSATCAWYVYPKEGDTETITFDTLNINTLKDVVVDSTVVWAYDEYNDLICDPLRKKVDEFTFPGYPYGVKEIAVTENDDHSRTFSWDPVETEYKYELYIYDKSDLIYSESFTPEELTKVDGKYTFTYMPKYNSANYKFYVRVYTMRFYEIFGYEDWVSNSKSFSVSDIPDLGATKLRVLVPSDNDLDIASPKGVWFKLTDAQTNTVLDTLEATESTTAKRWFELDYTANTSALKLQVLNEKSPSAVASYQSGIITSNEVCFELKWNKELIEADCDAPDHNYRIKDVAIDNSIAGLLAFSLTPEQDVAPFYYVYRKAAGSSDPYTYWFAGEGTTFSVNTLWTTTQYFDLMIEPCDENMYQIATDCNKLDVEVKANTNKSTNLKAEVGEDGHTVTFSWENSGTDVVYYALEARSGYDGDTRFEVTNITEKTYTATLSLPTYYFWSVTAYAAGGQALGKVNGPTFLIDGDDLTPYDDKYDVHGRDVGFSWIAPDGVEQCHFVLYDVNGNVDDLLDVTVSREGDQFVAYFTLKQDTSIYCAYYIESVDANGNLLSVRNYGGWFSFTGSSADPDPATMATLTVVAAAGGVVSAEVNGSYEKGANVSISATANSGWNFDHWSDGETSDSRTIELTQDTVLTAYFKSNKMYKVKISAGAHGKVTSNVEDGIYYGGKQIHTEAKPNADCKFTKWSDGDKNAIRDIILTGNLDIKANFAEIIYYTVKVTIDPEDGGSVKIDGVKESGNKKTVEEDTKVVLTAIAADGYEFVRWNDGDDVFTDKEITVKMTADKNIKVVFKKQSQGIEEVGSETTDAVRSEKYVKDGNLYIRVNERVFDAQGKKVK